MKQEFEKEKEIAAIKTVLGGAWGTIGPNFVKLIDTLGAVYGVKYGLATFSNTAALETALRGLDIGYGDEVLLSDYSLPSDTSVTVAIGATPVFCDVDENMPVLSVKSLENRLTDKTKAVIADVLSGCACNVKELAAFCRGKGLRLILNLGDAVGLKQDGIELAKYADAAVADMSEGTVWNVGNAGALLTDNRELFDSFFAYHNCGRPFGEGCTLSFGKILGGDLRIDEWQACLIKERLEGVGNSEQSKKAGVEKSRCLVMHRQPFIGGEYYLANTGSTRVYADTDFPNLVKQGL